MKAVLFFDTSVGTFNRGDEIIMKSIYKEFSPLLQKNFRLNFATHLVNYTKQFIDCGKVNVCNNVEYKFICGTDILWKDLFSQQKIGILQSSIIVDKPNIFYNSVLLGCGISKKGGNSTSKSNKIYKRNLSSDFYHSVRDNEAKAFLESLGIKVINTGCPTLWSLTKEHCKDIVKTRSKACVFALTSENKNETADRYIYETVKQNYSAIYFWVQRINDDAYLEKLIGNETKNIHFIYNLDEYEKLLEKQSVDYIGTRLHGGIFALQHKKRSIIISIDHRAAGMSIENNIPSISRDEIERTHGDSLNAMINTDWETNIKLNIEGIEKFKKQFGI